MASKVGNVLVDQVLGSTDAEDAFKAWWDKCKDFIVYGLIILGNQLSRKCY